MTFITEVLQAVGAFLGGLVGRAALFFAVLAVFAVPALLLALAARAYQARRRRALGLRSVAGVQFRPDVRYAPRHTWLAERRGGALTVGLDDLGQRLLTSVTAVELPRPGTAVLAGEPMATLSGGGRAVRIPAPISGTVVGVNAAVVRDPAVVQRDGYGHGWLVAIAPANREWEGLPHGDAAEKWMSTESSRLSRFLEQKLGFAGADGGELVVPAPWLLGEASHQALLAAFLGA
ncbi:MAG TPA: glycine cleavage system protein H [Anaeromyxobacteraceae bacterium]|nr:glycine cleavage system protein H [Anaeromyxobacteraceae bacterium]